METRPEVVYVQQGGAKAEPAKLYRERIRELQAAGVLKPLPKPE